MTDPAHAAEPRSAFPEQSSDEVFSLTFETLSEEEDSQIVLDVLRAGVAELQEQYNDEIAKIAIGTFQELMRSFSHLSQGDENILRVLPSLPQLEKFRSAFVSDCLRGMEQVSAERIVEAFEKRRDAYVDEHEEDMSTPKDVVEYALALVRSNQIRFYAGSEDIPAQTPYGVLLYAIEQNTAIEHIDAQLLDDTLAQATPSTGGSRKILEAGELPEKPLQAPFKGSQSASLARLEDIEPEVMKNLGIPRSQLRQAIVLHHLSEIDVETLADATSGSPLTGQHALVLMKEGHSPAQVQLCAAIDRMLDTTDDEKSALAPIGILEIHEGQKRTESEQIAFDADNRLISMRVVENFVDFFGFDGDPSASDLEDDIAHALSETIHTFGSSQHSNVEEAVRRALRVAQKNQITTWGKFREEFIVPRNGEVEVDTENDE